MAEIDANRWVQGRGPDSVLERLGYLYPCSDAEGLLACGLHADSGEVHILDLDVLTPPKVLYREPLPRLPKGEVGDYPLQLLRRYLYDRLRQQREFPSRRHPSRIAPLHPWADLEPTTSLPELEERMGKTAGEAWGDDPAVEAPPVTDGRLAKWLRGRR